MFYVRPYLQYEKPPKADQSSTRFSRQPQRTMVHFLVSFKVLVEENPVFRDIHATDVTGIVKKEIAVSGVYAVPLKAVRFRSKLDVISMGGHD